MAEGFIGDFPDRSDEVLCMNRSRSGIDHQHTIVANDDAGVGNAPVGYPRCSFLDVGVYIGRRLLELGLPTWHLWEFRVRSGGITAGAGVGAGCAQTCAGPPSTARAKRTMSPAHATRAIACRRVSPAALESCDFVTRSSLNRQTNTDVRPLTIL